MEIIEEQDINEILKVRREKLSELVENKENPFLVTKFDRTSMSKEIIDGFEQMEGQTVSVAGRLMLKRGMGKASFCDLHDRDGKIQAYVRADVLGDEPYAKFKKLDIGDIIGISGEVFRTNKGEISIKAHECTLLSKSMRPLPEKWHGLKDMDMRYRQRYVDLIMNPDVKNTFITRSKIIKEIRNYLDDRGFMEVETPVLNTIPGGAAARPFITHHNTLDIDMYLRIATELHLKRLIVGGLEKVYEMGRIFRNEGMDIKHNPEFTTIEIYEAFVDYEGMMELAEGLVSTVTERVLGTTVVNYQGIEIDFAPSWERISMLDSIKKYSGVDFSTIKTREEAVLVAKEHHIEVLDRHEKGDIMNLFFEEFVEEKLIQPTFVTDYPVEVSPLAKRKPNEPELTERFEIFVFGRELGNAFSELNDPFDQRDRFQKQAALRAAGDDEANMVDEDFLDALEYGMPPTGGIGIGIDRFIMFLTDSYSIRDVLLFPTMKPKD